jgi:hypothetical protein
MTKKGLILLSAVLGLSAIGLVSSPAKETKAADTFVDYALASNQWQISHMRRFYKTVSGVSTLMGWQTNWQQNSMPALSSQEASFIRGVITAPAAGNYPAKLTYFTDGSGTYPVTLYVNAAAGIATTLPSTNQTESTVNVTLSLQAGDNAVILQVNNWGYLKNVALPSTLTLKSASHDPASDGIYYTAGDSTLNDTVLVGNGGDLTSAATTVVPAPFRYDISSDYCGWASYEVSPKSDTKSLDLVYYQSGFQGAGNNGILVSVNGGADQFVELTASDLNSQLTQNLGTLTGFDTSKTNTIVLKNNSTNSQKIAAVALRLSTTDPSQGGGTSEVETTSIDAETFKSTITLRGRNFAKTGSYVMDWSGSGVEFVMSQSSLAKATFNAPSGANVVYVVDGVQRTVTISGSMTLTLAKDLDKSVDHTLKIYKTNEAAGGLCELTALVVEKGGTIAKTPAKPLRFDFLGDSVTCGNQIDHNKNIDAYGAFPRLVSDAFNADYHCTSVSGRGLIEGYNSESGWAASQTNELKDLYWQTDHFRDASVTYDCSTYVPDVMVIGVGNNDLGEDIMTTFGTTISTFTQAVKDFHALLRKQYPTTEIIYWYGAYQNRHYSKEYSACIDELAAGGDSAVHYLYVPKMGSGADNHPDYRQHQQIAAYLENLIEKVTTLKTVSPIETIASRYEAEDAAILGTTTAVKKDGAGITSFSEWGYVGEMGAASDVPAGLASDPSLIKGDGSDVKILSSTITIPEGKGGLYDFRMAYATSVDGVACYYKVDEGAWTKLSLPSTTGWATVWESDPVSLKLAAGAHTLTWTGALTSSTWVNYDYVDLQFVSPSLYWAVNYPTSEHYSCAGQPTSVEDGTALRFKVSLAETYSQSTLVVKANGTVLSQGSDGYYVLENVSQDVTITIEGEALNQWTLTFKDGDTVLSSKVYEVGAAIPQSEIPTPSKGGYKFLGWNFNVPETMPNGDLTLSAQWEVAGNTNSSASDGSSSASSNSGTNSGNGANVGLIVGLSVGGAVLVGGGIGLGVYLKKKHQ